MILAPYNNFEAITPSDTVDLILPSLNTAIYVGTAGNLQVVREDGTVVTFKGATAGSVLHIRPKRINSTNTTASDLVLLSA